MGTTAICLAILLPALVIAFLINIPRIERIRELASHRYICPSCGSRFHPKWLHLFFVQWQAETTDTAALTCPVCKTRDVCRREMSIYEEGKQA
ncbi:MAG: hypothetical protein IKU90_05385 [Clostridia bacterium]|nr:hypothetical protein [Clostridia bacterium]